MNATIHASDGGWTDGCSAAYIVQGGLISRQPNIFNSEAVLLPIVCTIFSDSSKLKIVSEINNARYLRINNYEPEQIIILGDEKWKVYPFYKKNSLVPNGGTSLTHRHIWLGNPLRWAINYGKP